MEILIIFCSIIGLFFNVLTQLILMNFFRVSSIFKSVVLGFLMGMIYIVSFHLYSFFTLEVSFSLFLANLISYICLGYCYFGFLGLVESARRTTILRSIKNSPNEELSLEEIYIERSSNKMLRSRIDRLIVKKQLKLHNDHLFIDIPLVLLISQVVLFMKMLVVGKKSEFD